MSKFLRTLVLWILIMAGISAWPLASMGDSTGQIRMAYAELTKLQALSTTSISYKDYRDAVSMARQQVDLLRDDSSPGVEALRKSMAYHEQALTFWRLKADSEFPVDSMRSDEVAGATIIAECPGISRFHYKERDQVYVKDAIACLWRKAAEALNEMPANLR